MTAPTHYTIIVGVDYSDVSRLAIREALNVASEHASCEVHVVHVDSAIAEPEPVSPAASSMVEAAQRLREWIDQEVTTFRAALRPFVGKIMRVVLHVRSGAPGKAIAQLAVDLQADLVAVGTHGRTGLTRVLLGSVAHAVVTLSPCPVLVMRAKLTPNVPGIEPACPRCLEARRESGGRELWCEEHRRRNGPRHTVYQEVRPGHETNFPLVLDEA